MDGDVCLLGALCVVISEEEDVNLPDVEQEQPKIDIITAVLQRKIEMLIEQWNRRYGNLLRFFNFEIFF